VGRESKASFIGSEARSVDEKGRSPIPRLFRRELEAHRIEKLILVPVEEAKLEVVRAYPPEMWQQVVAKLVLQELSANGEAVAWLFRAESVPCEIDSAGRILVPAKHRKVLGIGNEVIWSGQGPFIDLLPPDWVQRMKQLTPEERASGGKEIRRVLNGG